VNHTFHPPFFAVLACLARVDLVPAKGRPAFICGFKDIADFFVFFSSTPIGRPMVNLVKLASGEH